MCSIDRFSGVVVLGDMKLIHTLVLVSARYNEKKILVYVDDAEMLCEKLTFMFVYNKIKVV